MLFRSTVVTERVARPRIFQLPDRHNLSRLRRTESDMFFTEDLVEMAELLADLLRPVENGRICLDRPRQDPAVGQPPRKRVMIVLKTRPENGSSVRPCRSHNCPDSGWRPDDG